MARPVRGQRGKKISVSIGPEMVAEIEAEARRLDRSTGWVVRLAWSLARAELRKLRHEVAP